MKNTFDHLKDLRLRIQKFEEYEADKNEMIQPLNSITIANGIKILGFLPPSILHLISKKNIYMFPNKRLIIKVNGEKHDLTLDLISTGIRYSFNDNFPFIIDRTAFEDVRETRRKLDLAVYKFEEKNSSSHK